MKNTRNAGMMPIAKKTRQPSASGNERGDHRQERDRDRVADRIAALDGRRRRGRADAGRMTSLISTPPTAASPP